MIDNLILRSKTSETKILSLESEMSKWKMEAEETITILSAKIQCSTAENDRLWYDLDR